MDWLFGLLMSDPAETRVKNRERLARAKQQAEETKRDIWMPDKEKSFWTTEEYKQDFKSNKVLSGMDGKDTKYLVNGPYGCERANSYSTVLNMYERVRQKQQQSAQ